MRPANAGMGRRHRFQGLGGGCTAFYERLWKREYLRLGDMEVWHGQGRSRVVMPREGVEEVTCGRSSGGIENWMCTGKADIKPLFLGE